MKRVPKRDMVISIGYLNAKAGTTNSNIENIMGRHGLGERNENEDLQLNFKKKVN